MFTVQQVFDEIKHDYLSLLRHESYNDKSSEVF